MSSSPGRLRKANSSFQRSGSTVSGVGFAVYLIYTELLTLHAICLWCTSAHILALLIFTVVLFAESVAGPFTTRDTRQARSQA